MNPLEPLKYEKPLQDLKSKIAKEGSKSVFSPLIEKFILNNLHKVTVQMQVLIYLFIYFSLENLCLFEKPFCTQYFNN